MRYSLDLHARVVQGFVDALATPGVVPSDDYPPSLRTLEELTRLLPQMRVKDFRAGHHFLAEENPKRVVELVVETIRERTPVAAGSGGGNVVA